MEIEIYIARLLKTNDCVVLPGFGAFILKEKQAQIQSNNLRPPGKFLSFNSNLRDDDGLLIKSIAQNEEIKYTAAKKIIYDYCKELTSSVNEGLLVELAGIGQFSLGQENRVIFNPFRINFDPKYDGLMAFTFAAQKEKLVSLDFGKIKVHSTGAIGKGAYNTALKIAAVYIVLLMFTYPLFFMLKNDGFKNWTHAMANIGFELDHQPIYKQRASEMLFSNDSIRVQTPSSNVLLSTNYQGINQSYSIPLEPENKAAPVDSTSVQSLKTPGIHHIIVGCFKDQSNALKLIEKLNQMGYPAMILDEYFGLYRVSAGFYPSKSTAEEELPTLRASVSAYSWILSI